MTIPRRWQPPPVNEKTTSSDWWVFRLVSTSIASIVNYKRVNGKDTPESEDGIEMQEVILDSNDHDKCEGASRPIIHQQATESNFQGSRATSRDTNTQFTQSHFEPFEYSSLEKTMGLRAPR
ncbi:hypothetical protein KCU77_g13041, partial [Aureobasidium melanogenum]